MPAMARPIIERQGRDYNSRFAPRLRPTFPRSYFDNSTTKRSYDDAPTAVEKRSPEPAPIIDYADYIGATASASVNVGVNYRYD